MINSFWALFDRFVRLLTWWVVVTPWEQALRVRFGKRVTRLSPGIHLKIPVFDAIYKQSVRLRASSLPVQTITTADGRTITLAAVLNYEISDIQQLYMTLHHAEDTIRNLATGAIAVYVQTRPLAECGPEQIVAGVQLDLARYGIDSQGVQVIDYAVVRTYRLIMDSKWGGNGDSLDTTRAVTPEGEY